MLILKKINKNHLILFLINVLAFFPLLVFNGENFSIDSYGILLNGAEFHIETFISSYRFFGAFLYKILSLFGHNPIIECTIDLFIYIVLAAVSTTAMTHEFVRQLGTKSVLSWFIIDISVSISVCNVWFCDILSFPECVFLTGMGLFLCFFAVIIFVRGKNISSFVVSSILLICSTAVYQQFIAMFTVYIIAFCGIYTVNNHGEIKKVIINYIKSASLILVSGSVYLAIGKLFLNIFNLKGNSRVSFDISSIIENIKYFIDKQHSFLSGRGFFDTEILTISFIAVGLIWAIVLVWDWLKNKQTLKTIMLGLSYIAAYVSSYLLGLISTSHAARTMFPLFSIFMLFSVGALALKNKKHFKIIASVILLIVFSANILKIVTNEVNLKKQNLTDEIWATQVIYHINEYEETNDQEVKTIYYCYDDNSDIGVNNSYTQSATTEGYSLESMLCYYSGKEYEVIALSDEDNNYFLNKDWTSFDAEEQMMFVEDNLYLSVY